MKKLMKAAITLTLLAMILLNGVSSGNSSVIYSEDFNTGDSLRALGFTFSGREPDGWKLNTSEGCLESDPVKGHQKSGLYSPVFEANRTEGTVGLEWAVSFQSPRPGNNKQKDGHHGQHNGNHPGPKRQDWVRIGLIGDKGWLGYSLKLMPQEKQGKFDALRAELEKNGKRLKNAPPNLKLSQGDKLQFRIELDRPLSGKGKGKDKGKDKGINDICEIKVYYGVNGSGFREWFAVKEKTPYTRLVKVFLDQDINQFSDLQVKIDDLRVTGKVNDQTPPVTSHDYLYDGQWVKTPVTVNFTATDQGGGVDQVYYRINEGDPITGNQIQFMIDGIYTIEYWTVDQAGNTEVPKSLTVKLDQALPTISSSLTPAPNSSGWNNTDVTVSFFGTDALSGITSVTEPVQVITEGVGQVILGQAVDQAGNVAVTSVTVNLDKSAPVVANLQPANGAQLNLKRPVISAGVFDELSGIDPGSVRLSLDGQLVNGSYDSSSKIISYTPVTDLTSGSHGVTLNASDLAGNQVSVSSSFTVVISGPDLPPDPAEVAPALDPTIVSDMKTATSFLYAGENPIQTGVDPETIEPVRAAVIRGKVLDKDGQPLPGVKISILGHSEFGETKSRADGMFDLAVNGGGYLTVKYEKEGYLSAQRQVDVAWQDYVWTPEVIMVKQDDKVTTITLNSDQAQVHQGSLVTDSDGQRRATFIFPKDTQVSGIDGNLHIRATEYTVGPNGPKAMPAELPPTSDYTYCVELTADEAEHIEFTKPVYFYVENFLNFPIGCIVPVGYYDKDRGVWVPCDDGRTIRILSINDGIATVDIDGTGQAANTEKLGEFGFTTEELQNLASMYQVGQSLWRAPVKHFSIYDCNYGTSSETGAESPNGGETESDEQTQEPETECGSVIEIQNQILGENVDITGTPFYLNYSSDRVPGRTAANKLKIPLSGSQVPGILKKIVLKVAVAGQSIYREFTAEANQSFEFEWDGLDGYGRQVFGGQQATTEIGFVYDGYYNLPPYMAQSFGYPSGTPVPGNIRAREGAVLWKTFYNTLEKKQFKDKGVGGWSLSVHHFYDTHEKILYKGNGDKRFTSDIREVKLAAGHGEYDFGKDGMLAKKSGVGNPYDIAVAPNGELYISEYYRIRKVDHQGFISTVIGKAPYMTDSVETDFLFKNDNENGFDQTLDVTSLTTGPDGKIYFIISREDGNEPAQLYKLDNDIVQPVFSLDSKFTNISMSNFGNCYLYNSYGENTDPNRIYWLWTDDVIKYFAGTGESGFDGDGEQAVNAKLNPISTAVDRDGNLYIADFDNSCIRKISSNGIISTVAGIGGESGYSGDGGHATEARINHPTGIGIGTDGSIYILDYINSVIRKVNPDGIISTIADISQFTFVEPNIDRGY